MVLRDIRDALRSARRQPFLTLVIVLTLAVGIGAATAIFSYFADLTWHRIESPDAERLYQVFTGTVEQQRGRTSYPDAQLYREALADLGELAPWADLYTVVLTVPQEGSEPGETILSSGSAVSPGHFDFLGVHFTQGRGFLPEEHRIAGPRVAVISHTFWSRHMGADPGVIGRTLRLSGRTFTVVGVAPRGFENMGIPHPVYVPAVRYDDLIEAPVVADPTARRFQCLLRLGRGVRPQQAEARLAAVAADLDREAPWPEGAKRRITVRRIEPASLATPHKMLGVAVGLLLFLACANVANLLLVRAASRRGEIAVMAAVGASPGRIARRLLTESCLLAVAGAALGLLVARWLLTIIKPYYEMPFGFAHYFEGKVYFRFDERVLGLTFLVALMTGCLFGLAPIVHSMRTNLVSALKSGRAATRPGRRYGARHLLVVVQVALATALLLLAVLLLGSLREIAERKFGFETEHQLLAALVVTAPPEISPEGAVEPADDPAARRREVWRGIYEAGRQRLAALPGVEAATLSTAIPGTDNRASGRAVLSERPDESFRVALQQIGPDFLETFGIPLVRGRSLDLRDRAGARGAAIVNQAFVERILVDAEPLGQELLWPDLETDAADGRFQIVGVIPDFHHRSRREEPTPLVYLPLSQYYRSNWRGRMNAVARMSGPPRAVMPSARRALANAHPGLAVTELGTYDATADLLEQRLHSVLSGLFSLLGLALASLGVYGVMSRLVSYRLREFGIRKALGATARDLERLVLAEAARLTAFGALCGVGLAAALSKLVSSALYGVSSEDLLAFLIVPGLLVAVGLLAAWLPALRAGRVDPRVILQEE